MKSTGKNFAAENLKNLRESKKLTQAEFAKIAGVTEKTINHWENGKNQPRWVNLEKVGAHFGISVSDLEQNPKLKQPKEQITNERILEILETRLPQVDPQHLFDEIDELKNENSLLKVQIEKYKKIPDKLLNFLIREKKFTRSLMFIISGRHSSSLFKSLAKVIELAPVSEGEE